MNPSHNPSLTMDDQLLDIELPPTDENQKSIAHLWHGLKLTQALRWSGSIILAAAAIAFMYQGIYSFSPMTRHWIMLAVCLLLGLFGMVTGNLLKEEKGARLSLVWRQRLFRYWPLNWEPCFFRCSARHRPECPNRLFSP